MRFPDFSIPAILALLAAAPAARSLEVPVECDYLIVTDSLLLPQAQRLAEVRSGTALDRIVKPGVATMGDIEREFPVSGTRSRSLLAFLRDIKAKNGRLPEHIVLFGDASFDGEAPGDRVPTYPYLVRSPNPPYDPGRYDTLASDDVYGTLLDTLSFDSIRFFSAVGRIPAATVAQARAYVDKVETYETHYPYGPMAFTYGFANDDHIQHGAPGDLDPITNMNAYHKDIWDALDQKSFVRRMLSIEFPIGPDFTKPAARDSLVELLNAGPARFYFVGHSGANQLTDEKIFETPADLSRLKPKALQPIAALIGPYTAGFADRNTVSMGEHLLFHPYGVIAFLAPMAFSYPYPASALFQRWGDSAVGAGTLGISVARAKMGTSLDLPNNQGFALLGDPGLTLRTPAFDLVPAPGSGRSRLMLQDAGASGDSAYLQLVQIDTVPLDPFVESHPYFAGQYFLRERILGEVRGVLGPQGEVTLDIPWIPASPSAAAVKVMTWNDGGMRYGHFPLTDLGPVSLRRPEPLKRAQGYRLVMEGGRILFEHAGAPGLRVDLHGAQAK
jgi:peptidase C25-like protein